MEWAGVRPPSNPSLNRSGSVNPVRFDAALSEAGFGDGEIAASRRRRMIDAEEALEKFLAPWGDRVRALVIDGPPGDAIGEVVRRRGADLAVVATRGASDDSMVLLGTVAENVLGTAPCDVLVAHVDGMFRRP